MLRSRTMREKYKLADIALTVGIVICTVCAVIMTVSNIITLMRYVW